MHGITETCAMLFTHEGYRSFLRHLIGFGVRPLGESDGAPGILLRHDVDYAVGPAYELACIEREEGVRSTFFFMVSSPLYNLFEKANREALERLARAGFEIGLHFDPQHYEADSPERLEEAAVNEARTLEILCGAPVKTLSLHNPSAHGQYPMFRRFHNAYDPSIFDDTCYLSDSCMDFRGKEPFTFVECARRRTVQVLLHPIHFRPDGGGYAAFWPDLVRDKLGVLDAFIRGNRASTIIFPRGIADLVDYAENPIKGRQI